MMEIVQRSVGVQVNLCNCHCFLDQSIPSNLPPRSPRASSRSRHHFRFNKALSMDNSNSHTLTEIASGGVGVLDHRAHILGHSSSGGGWKRANSSGSNSGNNFFDSSSITAGGGGIVGGGGGGCHRDREFCYTQGYIYSHVGPGGQAVAHVNNSTSSRTTSLSEMDRMDSVSEEADENNKLLEFSMESTSGEGGAAGMLEHDEEDSSDNNILGDQDKSSSAAAAAAEASRPLLPSTGSGGGGGGGGGGSGSNLNLSENTQNQTSPPASTSSSTDVASWRRSHQHQTAADILNKRESHSYHFKRKYNFRSDSVFSDVMPMPTSSSSQEAPKSPEAREKSGSLSSLKGQSGSSTSKWSSLRKKLGRLNSSSEKHQHKALEHQAHLQHQQQQQQQQKPSKTAKATSLEEKRSLLQRAKTLSILPVHRAVKEDVVKKPKEVARPPELFNVGGEMNMIPLELLIDINDLKIQQ